MNQVIPPFLIIFLASCFACGAEGARFEFKDPEAIVYYAACLNDKVYAIGEPYALAFRIRDVLDQNFSKLAYSQGNLGYFTHLISGVDKSTSGRLMPVKLNIHPNKTRRDRESFNYMKSVQLKTAPERSSMTVFEALMGRDQATQEREKSWSLTKLSLDEDKLRHFFSQSKGKGEFTYTPHFSFGRLRLELTPNSNGGTSVDQLLSKGSKFASMVKQAKSKSRAIVVFHVAPNGGETFKKASAIVTSQNIPVGKLDWDGKEISNWAPNKRLESVLYDFSKIPADEYLALSKSMGPKAAANVNAMMSRLDRDLDAITLPDGLSLAEAKTFSANLKAERRGWAMYISYQVVNLYRTPIMISEMRRPEKVAITSNPPYIPHIRVFMKSAPPTKLRPPTKRKPPRK